MKNILEYFVFRPKHLINISQKSVCRRSTNVFPCSLFHNKNLRSFEFGGKNIIVSKNLRCFHTSIRKLEKVLAANENEEKKLQSSVIYYGELTARIKGLKIFSCISSIGTGTALPWVLQNVLNGNNVTVGATLCTCLGVFTFSTPILIHLITKKYVTEIRYNSATDTYTATTLSLFLRKMNIDFKVEDIRIPSQLPVLTTMFIKEKPVFIFSECFFDAKHYIKMMGYDKPIDLKLNTATEGSGQVKDKH